jgi:hypothetical protein
VDVAENKIKNYWHGAILLCHGRRTGFCGGWPQTFCSKLAKSLATEISPGVYQWIDVNITNDPAQFYEVRVRE